MDQYKQILIDHGCQVLRLLGVGGFGRVYLVNRKQNENIAAKIIEIENFDSREWNSGLALGIDKQNPFVIKYLDLIKTDEYVIIFMDYCNLRSLQNAIDSDIYLPIPTIRVIMRQLLEGIRLINIKGIIHRDIKGPNILLHCPPKSGRVILKIADFGLTKICKQSLKFSKESFVGTFPFLPPELIVGIDEDGELKVDQIKVDGKQKLDIK
ncbi:MAG: hypothetical protein EZS28_025051 [Streblomastix strix]|uniref:Protein kinase domain-containing protein n=1 Tax=Streblomastix strix TaxID=222440 RepID=A0A5J4VAB8_9EUKA|nr:MAG: hypothetical protein EZS28_025051 [Streblomastix strix]